MDSKTHLEKDVVLIVGGGGMSAIFSSGVLEVFEDKRVRDRIHSVYAVSGGALTAARYLMHQSALGAQTFFTRFSDDRFLKSRFAQYFFQALRRAFFPNAPVDEILDFSYFRHVILESEDKIDVEGLARSSTPFFVKVFNNAKKMHEYLPVLEPYVYEKVTASASMTPITSEAPVIDGVEYFDGSTISSDIDLQITKEHSDKIVVRIVNSKQSLFERVNLTVPLIVYILFLCLESIESANRYLRAYFKRVAWEQKLRSQPNVLVVASDLYTHPFCKNHSRLESAYQDGIAKGTELLHALVR